MTTRDLAALCVLGVSAGLCVMVHLHFHRRLTHLAWCHTHGSSVSPCCTASFQNSMAKNKRALGVGEHCQSLPCCSNMAKSKRALGLCDCFVKMAKSKRALSIMHTGMQHTGWVYSVPRVCASCDTTPPPRCLPCPRHQQSAIDRQHHRQSAHRSDDDRKS